MNLLVVGSVALDNVKSRAGYREEVLGGSATFFSIAASHYAPVRMVGIVGSDFPDRAVNILKERGVDLRGLEKVPGKTFRWSGEYADDFSTRTTLDLQLNVFEHFQPKLPADYRNSEYLFLGNIHPRLQMQVLKQFEKRPQLVAMDTIDCWITDCWEELGEVMKQADILFINDEELLMISGETEVYKAIPKVLDLGPRIVVLKKGAHGAMLMSRDASFSLPAFPVKDVIDPTGAGDSFGGGFMGWLARTGDLSLENMQRAMVAGTLTASFTVENFSVDGLLLLTKDKLIERHEEFRKVTIWKALNELKS